MRMYIPVRFKAVFAKQHQSKQAVRDAGGTRRQHVETLEPRMLFSGSGLSAVDLDHEEAGQPEIHADLHGGLEPSSATTDPSPASGAAITFASVSYEQADGPYLANNSSPAITVSAATSRVDEGSLYTLTIERTDTGTEVFNQFVIDWRGFSLGEDFTIHDVPASGNDWGDGLTQTSPTTWVVSRPFSEDSATYFPKITVVNSQGTAIAIASPVLSHTFDTDGLARVEVPGHTLSSSGGYATTVQDDGKILFASGAGNELVVGRLNPNGSVDASFGTAGFASADFGQSVKALEVLVDSKGRVVIAGAESNNANMLAARFLPNGESDASFGSNADGIANVTTLSASYAAALDPDDGIVFAGFHSPAFVPAAAVARITESGLADDGANGFGTNGLGTVPVAHDYSVLLGLSIDASTGDIWVTGTEGAPIYTLAAKFQSDGSLDTAGFANGNGYVRHVIAGDGSGSAITSHPDGSLYVTGYADANSKTLLVKLDGVTGAIDSGFNSGQPVVINATDSSGTDLSLLPTGEIVVAGYEGSSFALRQFQEDGTADTRLGSSGTLLLGSNAATAGKRLGFAVAPDGGFVMAGFDNTSQPAFTVLKAHTGVSVTQAPGVGENHAPVLNDIEVVIPHDTSVAGFSLGLLPLLHDPDASSSDSWDIQVSGGADQALFEVGAVTKALKVVDPGDQIDLFQWPAQFEVVIEVEDSNGLTDQATVRIRVSSEGDGTSPGSYNIIDSTVASAMREALGLAPDAVLTHDQVSNQLKELTLILDGGSVGISSLARANSLEKLTIIPADYSDTFFISGSNPYAFLQSLTNLKELTIHGAGISDWYLIDSYLAPSVETLDIRYNGITNFEAVLFPSHLEKLYLYGNPVAEPERYELGNESAINDLLGGLKGSLIQTDLVEHDPDAATTIEDLAQRLYYSPVRMYEWVVNNIEFQPYSGSMKGPLATLETRGGSAWDTVWLMAELLHEAGVAPADIEFLDGRLTKDIHDAQAYVGARGPRATQQILLSALLKPDLLDDNGTATDDANAATDISFDHTWMRFNSDGQTYYLDPAWKVKEQANPSELLEPGNASDSAYILEQVPIQIFDDPAIQNEDYFLNEYRQIDPVEHYENKVRDWLATNHPGLTIADILYDGEIIQSSIVELEIQNPDGVIPPTVVSTAILNSLSSPWNLSILDIYKQSLLVKYQWDHSVDSASADVYGKSAEWRISLPDYSSSRISIVPIEHSSTQIKLNLLIGGEVVLPDVGSAEWAQPIDITDKSAIASARLYFTLDDSLSSYNPVVVAGIEENPRSVNQVRVLAVDTQQNSQALLATKQASATEAQMAFLADPVAYLDRVAIGDTEYLKRKDRLVAGLLDVLGATHFYESNDAEQRLANLTGAVPYYRPALGTVSSATTLREEDTTNEGDGYANLTGTLFEETILQHAYPVMPNSIALDLPNTEWRFRPRHDAEYVRERFEFDLSQMDRAVLGYDNDPAAGTAYVMFSATPTHLRFPLVDDALQNDHFIMVKYDSINSWQYMTLDKTVTPYSNGWFSFEPDFSSDRIVAEVQTSGIDTVSSLEGMPGVIHGIPSGYAEGNLVFNANWWRDAGGLLEYNGNELYIHSYVIDADQDQESDGPEPVDTLWYETGAWILSDEGLARNNLAGFTMSYYESGTMERVLNLPAASTTNLFQLAESSITEITREEYDVLQSGGYPQNLASEVIAAIQGAFSNLRTHKIYITYTSDPVVIESAENNSDNEWGGVGYVGVDQHGQHFQYIIAGAIGEQGIGEPTNGGEPVNGYGLQPLFTNGFNFNPTPTTVSDPIDVASGAVYQDESDFAIPNLGVPLSFSRHYDSSNTVFHDDPDPVNASTWHDAWSDRGMGHGWSFSNSDRLYIHNINSTSADFPGDDALDTGTVIWFNDSGERLIFTTSTSAVTSITGLPAGDRTYENPYGVFGRFMYVAADQAFIWTDTQGNSVYFDTDVSTTTTSYGKLTKKTDQHGNGIEVFYDALNPYQIDYVRDIHDTTDEDRRIQYTYDSNGKLVSVTNAGPDGDYDTSADNLTWEFGYTTLLSGHIVLDHVKYPDHIENTYDSKTQYTYYGDVADEKLLGGLLNEVIAPNGGVTGHTYYVNRRGFQVTLPDGGLETVDYNLFVPQITTGIEFGRRTHFVDAAGNETIYQFDNNGKTTQELYADQTTVQRVWHAADGVLLKEFDAYGQEAGRSFDNAYIAGNSTIPNTSLNQPGKVYDQEDNEQYIYWGNDVYGGIKKLFEGSSYQYTINFPARTYIPGDSILLGDNIGNVRWTGRHTFHYHSDGNPVVDMRQNKWGPTDAIFTYRFYDEYGLINYSMSHEDIISSGLAPSVSTWTDQVESGSVYATANTALNQSIPPAYDFTQFDHNAAGQVTRQIRYELGVAVNESWSFYDNLGRQVLAMDANAVADYLAANPTHTSEQAYDDLDVANPPLSATQYAYNDLGLLVSVTTPDPDGSALAQSSIETSFGHDALGNITLSIFDPSGEDQQTENVYTDAGHLLRVERPDGTFQTQHYDAKGTLIAETDGLGRTTRYTLDDRDRVTRIDRPDGTTEQIEYTGGGRVARVTDPLGNAVTYEYDKAGRVVSETYPDPDGDGPLSGQTLNYLYTDFGELAEIKVRDSENEPAEAEVWYYFDEFGRQIATVDKDAIDAVGSPTYGDNLQSPSSIPLATQTVYDKDGNITEQYDRAGNVTWFFYDSQGRVQYVADPVVVAEYEENNTNAGYLTVTDPLTDLGGVTEYRYDHNGNVIETIDPLGNTAWTFFDDLGRVTASITPVNIAIWQQSGNSYNTVRDAVLTAQGYFPGAQRRFYDNVGNLTRTIDEIENQAWFFYDSLNRLTHSVDPIGVSNYLESEAGNSYDTAKVDPDALPRVTRSDYDAVGNLIRQYAADGTVTRFTYDESGRTERVLLPDGSKTERVYNDAGDLTQSIDALGRRSWFFYDALGRQTHVTDERGVAAYLSDGPTNHSYESAAEELADLDYTASNVYDQDGNLARQIDVLGNETWYFYDLLGRQFAALNAEGVAAYRAGSSQTAEKDYADVQVLLHDFVSIVDTATSISGLSNWSVNIFDIAGNVIQTIDSANNRSWFFYDALSRQIHAVDPVQVEAIMSSGGTHSTALAAITSDIATFKYSSQVYDAAGRLTESTDLNGHTTWFFYSANGQQSHVVNAEQVKSYTENQGSYSTAIDAINNSTATFTFTELKYDYSGELTEAIDPAGHITWFFYDELGRQTHVADAVAVESYLDLSISLNYWDAKTNDLVGMEGHSETIFDIYGNLIETIDPEGNRTWLFYDVLGRQTASVNARGVARYSGTYQDAKEQFEFAASIGYANGLPLTDASATVFNAAGEVTETIDAEGNRVWLFYDEIGRQTHVVNPIGVAAFSGDYAAAAIDLASLTPTLTHVSESIYDAAGNLIEVIDPKGNRSWFFYDALGRVTHETNTLGVDGIYPTAGLDLLTNTTRYTYDQIGNLIETIDPAGGKSWFFYDANGRLSHTTDARGTTSAGDRSAADPSSLTHTSAIYFDDAGNVTREVDALGEETWFFYDALDRVQYSIDSESVRRVGQSYDTVVHNLATYLPVIPHTAFVYDEVGNLVETTDGLGNVTWFFYDALGRQTHATDARGVTGTVAQGDYASADPDTLVYTSQSVYNRNGNVTVPIDALGNEAWLFYDELGRLTHSLDAERVADYLAQGHTYESVAAALPSSESPAGFSITRYDARGLVAETIDAEGNRTWFFYDEAGQQVQAVDAIGIAHYLNPDSAENPDYADHNAVAVYDLLAAKVMADLSTGGIVGRIDPDEQLYRAAVTSYDDSGNVVEVRDAVGNRTWWFYDDLNRQIAEYDSIPLQESLDLYLGNTPSWLYEIFDDYAFVDPAATYNGMSQWFYDGNGNIQYTNDAAQNDTWFFYDEIGQLTHTMLPEQVNAFKAQPTNNDRASAQATIDQGGIPAGASVTIYNERNQVTEVINELGNTSWFFYDALGQQTHLIDDVSASLLLSGWDAVNTSLRINPDSHYDRIARTIYDALGRVVLEVSADPDGTITDSILPSLTYFEYDAVGQLTQVTDPLAFEHLSKTALDMLIADIEDRDDSNVSAQSTSGHTTWYFYDELGRLTHETNAIGVEEYLATPGNDYSTALAAYGMGSLALSRTSVSKYDRDGRLAAFTDPEGNTTHYTYDTLGRMITDADTQGQARRYTYDALGNTLSITDRNGKERRFDYDLLGRQAREQWIDATDDSVARTIYTGYDRNGNVSFMADHYLASPISTGGLHSSLKFYKYNNLNQITNEIASPSNPEAGFNLLSASGLHTVPHNDELELAFLDTTLTDQDIHRRAMHWGDDALSEPGDIIFSIDGSYSKLTFQRPSSIPTDTYDIVYAVLINPTVDTDYNYDANGNLATITDIDGVVTEHGYDDANRRISTKQTGAAVDDKFVAYTYNGIGQVETISRHDGADATATQVALTEHAYDHKGRITAINHEYNDATNGDGMSGTPDDLVYAWTYDAADRIETATTPDDTDSYTYDDTNQLIESDSDTFQDTNLDYDDNGNRKTVNGNTVETDSNNRIVKQYVAGMLQGDYIGYTYDAEGNRTSSAVYDTSDNLIAGTKTTYEWDHLNQLAKITHPDQGTGSPVTWFAYDVFGNRTAKLANPTGGAITSAAATYYVYQGDDIARTYHDPDGNAGSALPTSTYYLHGPRTDDVIAQDDSATANDVLWSLADQVGSVRDVVQQTGSEYDVALHYVYNAFGGHETSTGGGIGGTYVDPHDGTFRYGFTGREYDAETGLYQFRARYYDPGTGAFISQDPSGFAGGDANLYRYAGNAPTFRTDPTGLAFVGINNTGFGAFDASNNSFINDFNYDPISILSDQQFYDQVIFGRQPNATSVKPKINLASNINDAHRSAFGFTLKNNKSPFGFVHNAKGKVETNQQIVDFYTTFYSSQERVGDISDAAFNASINDFVSSAIAVGNQFYDVHQGPISSELISGLSQNSRFLSHIPGVDFQRDRRTQDRVRANLDASFSAFLTNSAFYFQFAGLSAEAQALGNTFDAERYARAFNNGIGDVLGNASSSLGLASSTVVRTFANYGTYIPEVFAESDRRIEQARLRRESDPAYRLQSAADKQGNLAVNSEYLVQRFGYAGNALALGALGGAVEGATNTLGGGLVPILDPIGTAQQIERNVARHQSLGLSTFDSLALQLNPLTGLAEAIDGRSYQAQEFGRQLGGIERFERGSLSVLSTASFALSPVAGLRSFTGGTIGTTTAGQSAGNALALSQRHIVPRLDARNYSVELTSQSFDPRTLVLHSGFDPGIRLRYAASSRTGLPASARPSPGYDAPIGPNLPSGSFSITELGFQGYPAGVPRPTGPLRLLRGGEYDAARAAADKANRKIRRQQGLVGQPVDVHELKPVKFGGSPINPANKLILDRTLHRQQVTPWWNRFQRNVESNSNSSGG